MAPHRLAFQVRHLTMISWHQIQLVPADLQRVMNHDKMQGCSKVMWRTPLKNYIRRWYQLLFFKDSWISVRSWIKYRTKAIQRVKEKIRQFEKGVHGTTVCPLRHTFWIAFMICRMYLLCTCTEPMCRFLYSIFTVALDLVLCVHSSPVCFFPNPFILPQPSL